MDEVFTTIEDVKEFMDSWQGTPGNGYDTLRAHVNEGCAAAAAERGDPAPKAKEAPAPKRKAVSIPAGMATTYTKSRPAPKLEGAAAEAAESMQAPPDVAAEAIEATPEPGADSAPTPDSSE